jgi:hypothetical protein
LSKVVDRRERVVSLVDFHGGTRAQVGRSGDGPREYRMPWSVLVGHGDTVAVFDRANRRFLVIGDDGMPGESFTMESSGSATATPMSPEGPRAFDAAGAAFWAGTMFQTGPGSTPNMLADSFPVVKKVPGSGKAEAVGWLRRPNATAPGDFSNRNASIAMRYPLADMDDFVVLRDGVIVVLRAPEYRAEWWKNGRLEHAIDVPFVPVRTTEWHKADWRKSRASALRVVTPVSQGRLGTPSFAPAARALPEPLGWPAFVPPFEAGASLAASDGSVWVGRTARDANDTSTYDVIDRQTAVRMRVVLPKSSRVVGFGRGVVFVARADDDDLLYLERFALR